jgi:hypothetical protein
MALTFTNVKTAGTLNAKTYSLYKNAPTSVEYLVVSGGGGGGSWNAGGGGAGGSGVVILRHPSNFANATTTGANVLLKVLHVTLLILHHRQLNQMITTY